MCKLTVANDTAPHERASLFDHNCSGARSTAAQVHARPGIAGLQATVYHEPPAGPSTATIHRYFAPRTWGEVSMFLQVRHRQHVPV